MKKYFAPEIEIANFKALDVVTTSGNDTPAAPTSLDLQFNAGEGLEYIGYEG